MLDNCFGRSVVWQGFCLVLLAPPSCSLLTPPPSPYGVYADRYWRLVRFWLVTSKQVFALINTTSYPAEMAQSM